ERRRRTISPPSMFDAEPAEKIFILVAREALFNSFSSSSTKPPKKIASSSAPADFILKPSFEATIPCADSWRRTVMTTAIKKYGSQYNFRVTPGITRVAEETRS
ncbi:MAG: hypothetical protein QXR13_03280, partial [Candidatus Bathyarchaeia archaeon]